MTTRILLVCLGNICRSPMAEAIFRRQVREAGLADRIHVESAGTGDWHLGEPAYPQARAVLAEHGYDVDGHRARQVSAEWFDAFDRVVAMDRANVAALRRLARGPHDQAKISLLREYDPEAVRRGELDVPDPYGQERPAFDAVLATLETACRHLLADVRQHL